MPSSSAVAHVTSAKPDSGNTSAERDRPGGSSPILVAIVGGSGSGKSWLAARLRARLGRAAGRLSLDDFYLDRAHLRMEQRERLNFDHPRAIDWREFERTLEGLCAGQVVMVPRYDFKTHSRRGFRSMQPREIWLIEGLWLLYPRSLRDLFTLSVFLDCPATVRLRRRLQRDTRLRGRSATSVRAQFEQTVEPMHLRFIEPQRERAGLVLEGNCGGTELKRLTRQIRLLAGPTSRLAVPALGRRMAGRVDGREH